MLLPRLNWIGSEPNLVFASEQLGKVNRSSYLGSRVSPGGRMSDEVSSLRQKARLSFADLRHICRLRDIRLSTKDPV